MNLTRRSWYLLAILVPIVAWILASAQLASKWDGVHEAKPILLGSNFDAAGQSVAVFTDFVQADRDISCNVTRPEEHSAPIPTPDVNLSVDYDATRWYLIGLVEEGHEQMAFTCLPEDGHTDSATYAYSVVPPTATKETSADFLVWGGLAFGFFIALVIGYRRFEHLLRGD